MPISVVLLPRQADSEKLTRLSDEINHMAQSLLTLSEVALPHITIAQFDAPESACRELWDEAQQFRTAVEVLDLGGLTFLPQRNSDYIWVEVQVLSSNALKQLHAEVVGGQFAQNYSLVNAVGDRFRPHCTVALYKNQQIPSLDISKLEVLRESISGVTLAIGVNGENYTLTEVIYS